MHTGPIAVTGASGHVGGAVVDGLTATAESKVIALVRDASRWEATNSAAGVRVADYRDPAALESALAGVETLVFVSSDGETAPMLVHHRNVISAAERSGVGHVVYLSIVDVDPDSPFCYAPVHGETERMLRDSGLAHSMVRAGVYGEFLARWIKAGAVSGELALPIGSGRLSLVSRSDVARCLVAAARQPPAAPVAVTGDHSYDLTELAALTEKLAGRPVRSVPIGTQQYCAQLLADGVSPWWSYAFTSMFQSVAENRQNVVADGVARLTGYEPVPFADIARTAVTD